MRRISHQLGVVLLLVCASAHASDPPAVSVEAKSSSDISIDGKLEEPAWRDAPILHLVQQSPKPGAPTRFDTEVRIIIGNDHVYFGFVCHDPEPQRIAVHGMQRDGN